jgi:hypothetical protein
MIAEGRIPCIISGSVWSRDQSFYLLCSKIELTLWQIIGETCMTEPVKSVLLSDLLLSLAALSFGQPTFGETDGAGLSFIPDITYITFTAHLKIKTRLLLAASLHCL